MYDLPQKSTAGYLVNPAQIAQDYTSVPLASLKQSMKAAQPNPLNTETSLLQFYFYHHAGAMIENSYGSLTALPADLVGILERRQKFTNKVAKQMLFQVIASTHGHLFTGNCSNNGMYKPQFWDFFENSYGKDMRDFFAKNPNFNHFGQWISLLPNVDCGTFLRGTHATFVFCGSGAAKAWAGVSRLGADFITGHLSLENLADQAFSICHNGGSILNKGHFFSVCKPQMYELLDIQDSGQIPQWILKNGCKDQDLRDDVKRLALYFPELNEPINSALITNSTKKRQAYTQNIAKIAQAIGFGGAGMGPAPAPPTLDQKINTILLGPQAMKPK